MGFRKKARNQRNRKLRKKYAPCRECGQRAVRPQLHWFWGKVGTFQCDACHTTFEDQPEAVRNDPNNVWEGEAPENIELHAAASKNDPVLNTLRSIPGGISDFHREIRDDVESRQPDIELTPHQKSKKQLSSACFALGVLACLTIVGIPLGILFLVLASWLTPEPYKEYDGDN